MGVFGAASINRAPPSSCRSRISTCVSMERVGGEGREKTGAGGEREGGVLDFVKNVSTAGTIPTVTMTNIISAQGKGRCSGE